MADGRLGAFVKAGHFGAIRNRRQVQQAGLGPGQQAGGVAEQRDVRLGGESNAKWFVSCQGRSSVEGRRTVARQ